MSATSQRLRGYLRFGYWIQNVDDASDDALLLSCQTLYGRATLVSPASEDVVEVDLDDSESYELAQELSTNML